jgi:hypothetical protein
MDAWETEFRERLSRFEAGRGKSAVSVKIRVASGCFHSEHSPRAYALIDAELLKPAPPSRVELVEHENGPELLAILDHVGSAAGIIGLVLTILQARARGVKDGDQPRDPLEVIVRRFDDAGTLREETLLRVDADETITRAAVEQALDEALRDASRPSR